MSRYQPFPYQIPAVPPAFLGGVSEDLFRHRHHDTLDHTDRDYRPLFSEGLVKKGVEPIGNVEGPPLPGRKAVGPAQVFTGSVETAGAEEKGVEGKETAALKSEATKEDRNMPLVSPIPTSYEPSEPPGVTLTPYVTADNFAMPSEVPMEGPNPIVQAMKDGAIAEAISTAISDHIPDSKGNGIGSELEPHTRTPN